MSRPMTIPKREPPRRSWWTEPAFATGYAPMPDDEQARQKRQPVTLEGQKAIATHFGRT